MPFEMKTPLSRVKEGNPLVRINFSEEENKIVIEEAIRLGLQSKVDFVRLCIREHFENQK